MTNFEIRVTADLLRPAVVGVRGQGIALQKGDSRAHSIVCDVVRGGDPVELDGFTADVYAQYGSTKYKLTNTTVSGHTVTSVIDPGIYSNLSGVVTFAVKLINAAQGIDMTAAIILAVIEQAISDGAPQVPTSEAWTDAVIVRYLDQLKRNVDTFEELKADIEKDVQDFLGNVVYDADQAVNDWLNEHFADATWRITEEDKREIASMVSDNVDNAAAEHIRNTTIHVTASDKSNWNGKQDVISDLSTIRTNAQKGSFAYGADNEWLSSTSYSAGDYCIYSNRLWRCLVDHKGQTPSEGTYWTRVSLKSIKNAVDVIGTVYSWSSQYFNGTRKTLPAGTYVIDVQIAHGGASNLAIGLWDDRTNLGVGMAAYFNGSSNSSFVRVVSFANEASVGTHLYDGTASTFSSSINAVRIK